jgi:hypothetical protein
VGERLEQLVNRVRKSGSQEMPRTIFCSRTEPCELNFLNGSGQRVAGASLERVDTRPCFLVSCDAIRASNLGGCVATDNPLSGEKWLTLTKDREALKDDEPKTFCGRFRSS